MVQTAAFLFPDFYIDNLKLHSYLHPESFYKPTKAPSMFELDHWNMGREAQIYWAACCLKLKEYFREISPYSCTLSWHSAFNHWMWGLTPLWTDSEWPFSYSSVYAQKIGLSVFGIELKNAAMRSFCSWSNQPLALLPCCLQYTRANWDLCSCLMMVTSSSCCPRMFLSELPDKQPCSLTLNEIQESNCATSQWI